MSHESLGYAVRRCHRRFDRLLNTVLGKHGLKTGYWSYLRVLWETDCLTQKELSALANVAENTTAITISGMIKAGLIARVRDSADRRRATIRLTEFGWSLKDILQPQAAAINQLAARGIPEEDILTCLDVLEKMSLNLSEAFEAVARDKAALP